MSRFLTISVSLLMLTGCDGVKLPNVPAVTVVQKSPAQIVAATYQLRPGMTEAEVLAIMGPADYADGESVNDNVARMGVELAEGGGTASIMPDAFEGPDQVPVDPNVPIKVVSWVYVDPKTHYVVVGFRNDQLVLAGGFARSELIPAGEMDP